MNKLAILTLLAVGLLLFGCTQAPAQKMAPLPQPPSTPSGGMANNNGAAFPSDINENAGLSGVSGSLDEISSATATVKLWKHPALGSILVDGQGYTLYIFAKDSAGTSTCYDACAKLWPPFTIDGKPEADGSIATHLGTVARSDGTVQATYDGKPLYYYFDDTEPGQAKGEGVNGAWFVVKG